MTRPWLSVIMPVHNGERWLEGTLQSLVDQDDKGFECIIVDSSASSASLDIVGRFSQKLTLSVHRRPDILSWTEKTNLGVSLARADHLSMLHQDDLWLSGRATTVRRRLLEQPGGVMYLNPSLIVDNEGRTLGTWRCPLTATQEAIPADMLVERLLVQNFISMPAPVIRRETFLRVNGMDTALWYAGDWDLYLKLALAGPVYYHPRPFTCFRIHGGSLTMSGSRGVSDFRSQMQTVVDRYTERLPPRRREQVTRTARASVNVNIALACASNGDWTKLVAVAPSMLALGPSGMWRYFRDSRLVERLVPRLRARLAGNL